MISLHPLDVRDVRGAVDDPASICYEVVHKKHIFLQTLPLEDEGSFQGNLAGAPSYIIHKRLSVGVLSQACSCSRRWQKR